MDSSMQEELVRFKRTRDAMLHSDAGELEHHLAEFAREIRRNRLLKNVLGRLPSFDVDKWFAEIRQSLGHGGRLSVLGLPEADDERLVVLIELAESMASGKRDQVSIGDFGQMFGKFKRQEAAAVAMSVVLRPLAETLGDRLRDAVAVANPAVRELAGVPLDRVPMNEEIRIFLSHKHADKPLVEEFHGLLEELGYLPWYDDKDMRAGDVIHREIQSGFDQSCAVVFFVTKNFKDERWLKHEVDRAVQRLVEREGRFAIVTLVFDGAEVPRPLQNYLYVPVSSPVRAVRELVRALPVQLGPPRWKK